MNISDELINKAKNAKSIEELKKLAEENGVELAEELEKKFGSLSDDELNNVSGGCGGGGDDKKEETPQPVQKSFCNVCDNYKLRNGGAGGEYEKFYTGHHCESCYYFTTSSSWSSLPDPNYDGIGYCFYGIVQG